MDDKVRVSILTQPLGHNYGGLLQAYALQTYLMKIGCEVETLDRRMHQTFGNKTNTYLKNLARLSLRRIKTLPTVRKHNYIFRNLLDFRDKNLELSRRIASKAQLEEYYQKYAFDVVIVGSDQVWRPKYSPSLLNYYLDFLNGLNSKAKRMSYAASFGVAEWEYTEEDTLTCKRLIRKFNAVSVREQSAVSLCQTYFGITPELVVDPTLLLETTDYEKLLCTNYSGGSSEGQIFSYMLDPKRDKHKIEQKISKILGRKIYSVMPEKNITQVPSNELEQCQYSKVETWLQGFKDAHFVVTDSFHGCIFSILFIAVGNAARGLTRFNSLLSMFHLDDRMVCKADELPDSIIEAPIDWERVNRIREKKVAAGRAFLRSNIYQDCKNEH
jgi:hypothetical protein